MEDKKNSGLKAFENFLMRKKELKENFTEYISQVGKDLKINKTGIYDVDRVNKKNLSDMSLHVISINFINIKQYNAFYFYIAKNKDILYDTSLIEENDPYTKELIKKILLKVNNDFLIHPDVKGYFGLPVNKGEVYL